MTSNWAKSALTLAGLISLVICYRLNEVGFGNVVHTQYPSFVGSSFNGLEHSPLSSRPPLIFSTTYTPPNDIIVKPNDTTINDLSISETLLALIGKEILETIPKSFSPIFKNPCWYENNQLLRCLPYFYVAGMPKCGTSDLLSKINHHPDVFRARKEIQWWTRGRYGSRSNFSLYLDNFNSFANLLSDGDTFSQTVVGDGSASTLWDNSNLARNANNSEIKYTHADILRMVQPKAKMIGIFRNPTDRLYSDYKFFKRRNKTQEGFHLGVIKSIHLFNDCLQKMDLRRCSYLFKGEVRLNLGIYNIFVGDWLRKFPRHQLYFLRTDEWKNCTSEYPKIITFLELGKLNDTEVEDICNLNQKNTGKRQIGPMWQETRNLLDDFYKPFMEDLAEKLEDKRYTWSKL